MSEDYSGAPYEQAMSYQSYLHIPQLLSLQQQVSGHPDGVPEHDELLFIIIHQTYELWFKQLLHEMKQAHITLAAGDTYASLGLLSRIRTILKICVAQVDILETMTPLQFMSFRGRLESSSGFQSAQFRMVEVLLGRRDARVATQFAPNTAEHAAILQLLASPSLWDSCLRYFLAHGYPVPGRLINRDVSTPYCADADVQHLLLDAHRHDPEVALVCERLVDIDEGLQEWRYRHVKMVERTIGRKQGTGGSSGVDYLTGTVSQPVFPDLWAIRSEF